MSKIKVSYNLISDDQNIKYEGFGIKKNNRIIIKEKNLIFVLEANDKTISLNRKSNEYELCLFLNEDNSNGYLINEIGKINLEIKLLEYKYENNIINISYLLNDQKFTLKLNYEVVE